MQQRLTSACDIRQTKEWGEFLAQIGWRTEKIGNTFLFIRNVPWLGSVIKIQHPSGLLPFARIDTVARRHAASFVVVEPHSTGYDERSFLKWGYRKSLLRYVHSATILLNLRRSETALWRGFSQNARRNIRRAEQTLDVSLTEKIDVQTIQECYALFKETGKRQHFWIPPFSEIEAKMLAFQKHSVILFAYEKGKRDPVACLWLAYLTDVAVYMQPGSTATGYACNANYLLVWKGIQWLKKKGIQAFDFESIYDPRYPRENTAWKGYTEFKQKFSGEVVQYPPSWIKIYNPGFNVFYRFMSLFMK